MKTTQLPMLKLWCDKYYEDHTIRVHPTNVPVDLVLEHILQCVADVHQRLLRLESVMPIKNQKEKS